LYYVGIKFVSNAISDYVVDEDGGVVCHSGRFCDEVNGSMLSVAFRKLIACGDLQPSFILKGN